MIIMPISAPIGNHKFNMFLAISALIIASVGTLIPLSLTQKIIFLFGVGLLDLSAILERQIFFVILQTIAFVGVVISFFAIPTIYKAAIPMVLAVFAVIYFIMTGRCKNKVNLFGIAGLLGLALGFAISNPIAYMIGGMFIVMYSYANSRHGNQLAIVFLILNIIFTITSAIGAWYWLHSL